MGKSPVVVANQGVVIAETFYLVSAIGKLASCTSFIQEI